jgi:hypothetical protein
VLAAGDFYLTEPIAAFACELSVAKLSLHVDVNVGDPVWPAPHRSVRPRLLDGRSCSPAFHCL